MFLFFNKRKFTPFVIVGMPRTGSTLLLSFLQQHPNLAVHEELFHFQINERSLRHAIFRKSANIYFDDRKGDAIEFLRGHVFKTPPKGINAVGLKIFGEFTKCPGTRNLFLRIRDEFSDVHVIHIVRHNYLDVLVSRALALASGQWEDRIGNFPSKIRLRHGEFILRVDAQTAESFFQKMAYADRYFEKTFLHSKYCRVNYEDLSCDTANEMEKVFSFLGQTNISVTPVLNKQNTARPSEIIENYSELKSLFFASEFGEFFVDTPNPLGRGSEHRRIIPSVPDALVPNLSI